jgi:hypothetical protein
VSLKPRPQSKKKELKSYKKKEEKKKKAEDEEAKPWEHEGVHPAELVEGNLVRSKLVYNAKVLPNITAYK